MSALFILIPIALFLGGLALYAFFWSLRSGQFDDLDGAGMRILIDDEEDENPTKKLSKNTNVSTDQHK